jgi:hypothetical protein
MLPDLWRMAHRRVRPRPGVEPPENASPGLRALFTGVQHHLKADDVFHRHPVFTDGEKKLAGRFKDAEMQADKIGLFAHIGWELSLDGALLRRVGVEQTLDRLRAGLDDAAGELAAVVGKHASEVPEDFHDLLEGILQQVAWSDWVPGYAHGEGVARRLAGVRRRVGLPVFTTADLSRLGRVFEMALDDADLELESFLTDWTLKAPWT